MPRWSQKPTQGTPLNLADGLTAGLVGYWPMNEGGGDLVTDISGNGQHGTISGVAYPGTPSSGWNPGLDGPALACDGNDDGVDFGSSELYRFQRTDPFSVAMWMYLPNAISSNHSLLGNLDSGDGWAIFLYNASPILQLWLGSAGNLKYTVTTPLFSPGTWHHLVCMYDASQSNTGMSVYFDGISQPTTAGDNDAGASIVYIAPLTLGHITDAGHIPAIFSSLMIYNRTLTALEIQQLYSNSYG